MRNNEDINKIFLILNLLKVRIEVREIIPIIQIPRTEWIDNKITQNKYAYNKFLSVNKPKIRVHNA